LNPRRVIIIILLMEPAMNGSMRRLGSVILVGIGAMLLVGAAMPGGSAILKPDSDSAQHVALPPVDQAPAGGTTRPAAILNACAGASRPGYWVKQLKAADPETRSRAAKALGEMRDAAAVRALIEALRDPDAEVRLSAVQALGRMGAEARPALAALTGLLTDTDPAIRSEVAKSVEKIQQPR